MATAPKVKPVKAAGKQKTPAQTASGEADSARATTFSTFEQALCAAQELLLGTPDGRIGELEKETWAYEISTRKAICEAQVTEKLSAFHSGFDELQGKLCASATKYHDDCFDLALSNRAELDAILSTIAAMSGSMAKIDSPAEFARGFTTGYFSTFLRVTALDGKEKAQEINSNGRVREFIRHVCGDLSDVNPSLYTEQNTDFRLPQWFEHEWNIKVSLGKLSRPPHIPAIDESSTLNIEETEKFILGTEEMLIWKLRAAIAHAHLRALVKLGKTGIATPVPSKTAPVSAFWPEMPEYKSELKKAVRTILGQEPDASDHRLCELLDETMNVDLPPGWTKPGNREFTVAYEDKKIRPTMERLFSGVRRDMRAAGHRIR